MFISLHGFILFSFFFLPVRHFFLHDVKRSKDLQGEGHHKILVIRFVDLAG